MDYYAKSPTKLESHLYYKERCEILKKYGFIIFDKDYLVRHPALNNRGENIVFDFSATRMEPDAIMYEALQKAYQQGKKDGELKIKTEINDLIKIDVD